MLMHLCAKAHCYLAGSELEYIFKNYKKYFFSLYSLNKMKIFLPAVLKITKS